jgi:DNA-binding transcriptional LysR family regulator
VRSGRSGRSLLGTGPSLGMAALCALPLIVPPVGRPLRTTLDEAAAALGLRLQVQVEASGWEAVTRLVALGVGVGVINDVVGTTGMVRMPIQGLPSVTYRALRRRGRSPAIVDDVVAAMATAPA